MWRKINFSAKTDEKERIPSVRIESDHLQQSLVFIQPEILIGRDAENDIQLDDETVSGIHARIFFRNNQWMIEDLHSTNGTFINEERIATSTVLVSQDVIACGARHFSITLGDESDSPQL
jgi:pSer/pThr/pTyr-binding forkhead associated (FHA) protein